MKIFKTEAEYLTHLEGLKTTGRLRERKKKDRTKANRLVQPLEDNVPSTQYHPPLPVDPVCDPWNFSLVHPSFGRPMMALDRIREWTTHCSPHNHVDYILSVQEDDYLKYLSLMKHICNRDYLRVRHDIRIMSGKDQTMIGNLNEGATFARGDVLIYLSDDFHCPPNWDVEIQKAVLGQEDTPWVLHVSDGHQTDVQTISIMSREYYSEVGYMYCPDYMSMFVDNDYTERTKLYGRVINAKHLVFLHEHYIFGDHPIDETYKRQNSPEAWKVGERVFAERRKKGFRP